MKLGAAFVMATLLMGVVQGGPASVLCPIGCNALFASCMVREAGAAPVLPLCAMAAGACMGACVTACQDGENTVLSEGGRLLRVKDVKVGDRIAYSTSPPRSMAPTLHSLTWSRMSIPMAYSLSHRSLSTRAPPSTSLESM
eukprot:TRINITY_DN5064_c0_g1_i3.p1 TRINITY_DN5064_c0_g1~~TRINITY_DN5064_c0_g1_i3.p1  ORF type:complete len:165 (+),score=4.74 TRINITY_DN5064_c0_g1_i3:74-496(+)